MGKFLRQLLEQDAPVGGGAPAGDPELCFDPNTGEQIACPPAGETQAAAGGQDPALGGGPANQDTILVPEAKKVENGDEKGEVKPDDNGACPEGYEKDDDGDCKPIGGSEKKGDGEKKEETVAQARERLINELAQLEGEDDDKPAFLKGKDKDEPDDDEEDDEDGDDDDEDDKDKSDDEKKESLMYRDAVANMVKGVLEGGKARNIVSQAFGKK